MTQTPMTQTELQTERPIRIRIQRGGRRSTEWVRLDPYGVVLVWDDTRKYYTPYHDLGRKTTRRIRQFILGELFARVFQPTS